MKLNIKKLKKSEIDWLATHYCKHSMSYLEHQNCFFEEAPKDSPFIEKIGFLDIETSGFYADYDFMLSWCILNNDTDEVEKDLIQPDEIRKTYTFDKRIVASLSKALKGYDRVIVYNGVDYRFDIPFARTRALRWGIDFPGYKEILVEDAYIMVKQKLRLSRKKLGNACGLLEIPAKTLPGDPNIWMRASAGDKKELEYVLAHNIEDVVSLKELYNRLNKYVLHGKRSI